MSVNTIESRAHALLKLLETHRKDDGQGMSVKITSGQESVELTITAKPSSGGGWRGRGGAGEPAAPTPKTIPEMITSLKEIGFADSEIKVAIVGTNAEITLPYKQELNDKLRDAGFRWNRDKKVREHPLKSEPSEQRATAQASVPATQVQTHVDGGSGAPLEIRARIVQLSKEYGITIDTINDMIDDHMVHYEGDTQPTIEQALLKVMKVLKENSQTPQPTASNAGKPVASGDQQVNDYLEGIGLNKDDISLFNITIVDDKLHLTPKKFMGDMWGKYNDVFRQNSGVWIRDQRNSHWELQW